MYRVRHLERKLQNPSKASNFSDTFFSIKIEIHPKSSVKDVFFITYSSFLDWDNC